MREGVSISSETEAEKHRKIYNKQNQSFAIEYSRLKNRFERALIEHKLAADYFGFRAFYFSFLPLTIIATATTIIGFLISGSSYSSPENIDGSQVQDSAQFEPLFTGEPKQIWSIVIGILGAISTLLNTIGKHTNYQSRYDMHLSAVKALEKICLTVDFEQDWFKRKADSDDFMNGVVNKRMMNPESNEHENLATLLGADLKSHQASFKAMQDACSGSPAPTRVIQAFTVLDKIVGDGTGDSTGLILYYHKLWKEYSTYMLWPLKAPNLDIFEKKAEWVKKKGEGKEAERCWGLWHGCYGSMMNEDDLVNTGWAGSQTPV